MAESVLRIRATFDPSSLIDGLRAAATALEASQAPARDSGNVTLDEALEAVIDLVTQHCHNQDGDDIHYETSALSANRDAFDLLVRAGRAIYVEEPYGRVATIALLPEGVPVAPEGDDEPMLDPDCRDGKHGTCIGDPCGCRCHTPVDGLG